VESVHVVVGADAPKIERYAASELAAMLPRLFTDVTGAVVTTVPDRAANIILVGSPSTNPQIRNAIGSGWPELTDQIHQHKVH
jgi:hypothetical protein